MILFHLVIALILACLAQPENPYGPSFLDPTIYGVRVAVPDAEWELVPLESSQYRLVFKPRAEKAPFARLQFARVPGRVEPASPAAWNVIGDEIAAGFREAFPRGVETLGIESVQTAGRQALQAQLRLQEGDGAVRSGVSTTFFHGGDAWKLELVAAPEAFDRHLPSYKAIRAGIGLESSNFAVWALAGAVVLAAAAWLAFFQKKASSDN